MSNPSSIPTPPIVKSLDGKFHIRISVMISIPVDPLDGFTEQEAPQVALDRLAELPLEITLGGVPLDVVAEVPLFEKAGG